MSLTSYRAAPPRDTWRPLEAYGHEADIVQRDTFGFLARFGGDLLSHALRRSTIGAAALNGRVRDGIGCFARAMTTKPRKKPEYPSLCMLLTVKVWLLLGQIKPIGQLVPVS